MLIRRSGSMLLLVMLVARTADAATIDITARPLGRPATSARPPAGTGGMFGPGWRVSSSLDVAGVNEAESM